LSEISLWLALRPRVLKAQDKRKTAVCERMISQRHRR